MLLLDRMVSLHQATCFPLYRIARVSRRDYIAFDRHHLGYLNFYERLHYECCAHANGLLAWCEAQCETTASTGNVAPDSAALHPGHGATCSPRCS